MCEGMSGENRRRSIGKVDRLPPELKDTVEQMLLTGSTYKEIAAYLKENGEEMSQMAICTYAKKYLATVEMINVAQSNFSMLMDEMNRYPDLDTSEALIRLASHHVMNALTNVDEEQMKEVPVDKLIKETNGLIRAAAYKKRIEVQTRENYEAGLEAVKGLVFEAMAKEQPELYRQVSAYLNKKKQEGMEG
ncbi:MULTISPECIES: phage protein Gp27 family protein [Lachnospiraceae]|nr:MULTISPECIES: phage protein Gp27 family protein [Clostridia]